jgi:two-component system, LytTR family, sensor kinase
MHPVIFIGASGLLGAILALQDWNTLRQWGYRMNTPVIFEAWIVEFLLWGTLCWLLWWLLEPQIQTASALVMITRVLPLSVVTSVIKEMAYVLYFPNLPMNRPHMTYWPRLAFHLNAELISDMVIFWCAFFLFRGIGYYQQFRDQEKAASQLEVELAHAKVLALRMQLNPHFLFNTMNGISCLMRIDVDAADTMLEQLSSLLRMTLERGDVQLITLREEMEFVEMYLAMQDQRYAGRVRQILSIDPELHDALVPAMILQPIVENAFVHGLSKLTSPGELVIESRKAGDHLNLKVMNSGTGLSIEMGTNPDSQGIGLSNVKSRLDLHYGIDADFSIVELDGKRVQVTITLPLRYSYERTEQLARFGA